MRAQTLKYFQAKPLLQKILFLSIALCCLSPLVSAPLALMLGFLVIEFVGNPFINYTKALSQKLLQVSVVGLGFGMNIHAALEAGKKGFLFALISIVGVMFLGYVLFKILKIERVSAYLISAGTAICGGSAIAAIAPIIKAKEHQISVALAVVFVLNALALLIFPPIGHLFKLSQYDFGLWSAIAIHDTSSVVGAASKYGDEALQVATTVKLARALWIIPLSFISAWLFKNKDTAIKIPWFIAYFILAMCLSSYVPIIHAFSGSMVLLSKSALTLTLFLIGTGLSLSVIKSVGTKPLILALILWVFIASAALWVIIG